MFIRYLDNAVDNVVDNIYGPLLDQGAGDHVYVDLVPQPRPQSSGGAGVQTLGCVPHAEPFAVWENQKSYPREKLLDVEFVLVVLKEYHKNFAA